jgi:hypothetical protein
MVLGKPCQGMMMLSNDHGTVSLKVMFRSVAPVRSVIPDEVGLSSTPVMIAHNMGMQERASDIENIAHID